MKEEAAIVRNLRGQLHDATSANLERQQSAYGAQPAKRCGALALRIAAMLLLLAARFNARGTVHWRTARLPCASLGWA